MTELIRFQGRRSQLQTYNRLDIQPQKDLVNIRSHFHFQFKFLIFLIRKSSLTLLHFFGILSVEDEISGRSSWRR